MSLNPIETLIEEAAELAPAAIEALVAIVRGAKKSDDATRYLQRKAESDAAHLASQAIAKEALDKLNGD